MTRFVVDARAALRLAGTGTAVPDVHTLLDTLDTALARAAAPEVRTAPFEALLDPTA
ncbi:hypothetical protein [Cellulomonas sp.]|uniref:hypothetical protein n=1 Tax=Cellulomonas sp. TaxID=40001 RepID=UPI001B1444BD|nr:hypothetical protein [Cellulomonas sp.]MBO9556016.1 hypothetical protein [Cellulomonas sp.]